MDAFEETMKEFQGKRDILKEEIMNEIDFTEQVIYDLAGTIASELRTYFDKEDEGLKFTFESSQNLLCALRKSEEDIEHVKKAFRDFRQSTKLILKRSGGDVEDSREENFQHKKKDIYSS
jgi:hypothetical protein